MRLHSKAGWGWDGVQQDGWYVFIRQLIYPRTRPQPSFFKVMFAHSFTPPTIQHDAFIINFCLNR